jgi:chromate transporter
MKNLIDVFWQFLLLGCISFGGPAAHIGYFRRTFIEKRQWMDESSYAQLIALSQFLPGPGSSQIGFALGLHRAGLAGGIAAFVGFTLPSFVLLYLLATASFNEFSSETNSYSLAFKGLVHGLKLLAVIVVADALIGMSRMFCRQNGTIAIAVCSAMALLWFPALSTQLGVLLFAALLGASLPGRAFTPDSTDLAQSHTTFTLDHLSNQLKRLVQEKHLRLVPLLLFTLLLVLSFSSGLDRIDNYLAAHSPALATQVEYFSGFYQAGSLVFGGGHVVLPLLQQTLPAAINNDDFLLAYASAQAVPGPMFTMATFLGAELSPKQPLLGALLATLAVFLPGFLLVLALKGAWQALAAQPRVAGASAAINAAVVGLLLSALYQPVFITAVYSAQDMALVIAGLFALRTLKLPVIWLVLSFATMGVIMSLV